MRNPIKRAFWSARSNAGILRLLCAGRHAVAGGLCLLMLAACAAASVAQDEVIKQRAQARWDALLAGDYPVAYSYASPGYRSSASVTDFEISMRARRVKYVSAEYNGHHCEDALCAVKVRVGYEVVRPVTGLDKWKGTSLVEERWIYSDGNWWYVPQ